jgi:hypothetical protein
MKTAYIGSVASIACMAHCVLMPTIVATLPMVGLKFVVPTWADPLLMATAIGFCMTTFCFGYRKHRRMYPGIAILSGAILLTIGHNTNHCVLMPLFGGACFLTSMLLNKRLCHACHNCH